MDAPTDTRTEPFPVDWNAWRAQWNAWKGQQITAGNLERCSYRFPSDKNFMADEVLGVWSINGRAVELSELTFPALGDPERRGERNRHVGVTFGESGGGERETALVSTFAELEEVLGIE